MQSRTRVAAVAALTVLFAACSERQVFDPLPQAGPTESGPAAPFVPVFPEPAKAAQVYAEPPGLYANLGSQSVSRFVLYDDGTFELQFARGSAPLTFKGRYGRDGASVKFDWDDWPTTDSWFSETPPALHTTKVPLSETGTANIGISVARQFGRNTSTTMNTRMNASMSVG